MRPPLFLPLLTLVVYLFWRGYDYAISDQDEIIPYMLRLLDTSLYPEDWFVNLQMDAFGPRTLFVWMLYVPARLIGPYASILLVYVASWWGTASALYALGLRLTRERLGAVIGVILILVLTPKFTLGGNDLVTWILTPSMTAWACALWGLINHLRGRNVSAALLFGLATWMQALVGLQLAMVCGMLLIWKHRTRFRATAIFCASYAVAALPALGPLLWNELMGAAPEGPWSYFYILFEFRAPHHYIPTSFTPESALGFAGLLVAGLLSLRFLPQSQQPFIRRTMLIVAALCAVTTVCTEWVAVEAVAKLQLFKLSVLVKVLAAFTVAHALARVVLSRARRPVTFFLDRGHYALAATVLVAATLVLVSPDALGIRVEPVSLPEEQVAAWAKAETDTSAVFAVPPTWAHFRSQAERAIVVDFKAVPFHEPYMTQWFSRLIDWAPVKLPERGGLDLIVGLDSAYQALSRQQVHELSEAYGVDYVVQSSGEVPESFEAVHTSGPWTVWRTP